MVSLYSSHNVEYLVGDIILWTGRYPELKEAIYTEDIWFNESMEINVGQYRPLEDDSNYTELLDWEYSALCLLGKSDNPDENVEPCFINSKVQPYKFELSNEFTETFSEMKNAISICFESNGGETERMTEEKITEIFAELEIAREEVDFEISDEMTEEELRARIDEFKCKKKKFEDDETSKTETEDTIVEENSETENADNEVTEIIEKTVEEDKIDYCVEYGKLKMEYDTLVSELEALRKFKTDIEKLEREKAESEVFAKFDEKLGNITEYKALKEHSDEYEIKALEKECYAIYGMNMVKTEKVETPIMSAKFSLGDIQTEKKP